MPWDLRRPATLGKSSGNSPIARLRRFGIVWWKPKVHEPISHLAISGVFFRSQGMVLPVSLLHPLFAIPSFSIPSFAIQQYYRPTNVFYKTLIFIGYFKMPHVYVV
jgi:hypothetical protein